MADLGKGGECDGDGRPAQGLQPHDSVIEEPSRLAIAKELQVVRDAETEAMGSPRCGHVGVRRDRPHIGSTPTKPVANWSRFVLPMGMAPAAISRATAGADRSGV
jgi:hypothetical protein